jgi:hypothetical protein
MSVPDYPLAETIDFKFTTRAFADGVPTTLAGTPVIEVYEDNSLTQITAGETLTVDFDGVTGLNNLRIVATGANGYERGKSYFAVLSAGTVAGTSVVGEVVQQFSIERSPGATLVSIATEARLAELDAANLPADIDSILTQVNKIPEGVKKNTALSDFTFVMYDSADSKTPKTGLTVTGQRSLDAGAPAAVGGAIAEISLGLYQFDALAADTNADFGVWIFSAVGADDTIIPFMTTA